MDLSRQRETEIVLGLAIACVSFLTGQAWDFGRLLYRRRKLKRALETEIKELHPWLRRNIITLQCMIQLSCMEELANHIPVPMPVQVHAEHFPEINLDLSKEERTSINGIYNLIFRINQATEKLVELSPKCASDPDTFGQLRQLLDQSYRNSHHALLLIELHVEHKDDLASMISNDKISELYHELENRNDSDLLKLAAEAKKEGALAIRKKYKDGAVSVSEVAPTPIPISGHFYFDATGAKYKCLSVESGVVNWIQLETKIGALTCDVHVRQPIESVRHFYEITDEEEQQRLNRRHLQLIVQLNSRK
jgi:hypothetical protein